MTVVSQICLYLCICSAAGVDCSTYPGADAAAKIANCIAALPSTGGIADATAIEGSQTFGSNFLSGVTKPLTLLTGYANYTVNATIIYPSNFRWIASGTTLTLSFNGHILQSTGTTSCSPTTVTCPPNCNPSTSNCGTIYNEFSGLTLNGNTWGNALPLLLHQGSYGRFYNNVFTDSGALGINTVMALRILGAASMTADHNEVRDNLFMNTRWISVALATNANYNVVAHNVFQNCWEAIDINGDAPADSEGNEFSSNEIDGCQPNNFLQSATGTIFVNNVFTNAQAGTSPSSPYLTVLLATGTSAQRTVISGNQFRGNSGMGPCLELQNNVTYFVISNNTFSTCGTYGIFITVSGVANTGRGIIGENYFLDNGIQNPTQGFSAIELNPSASGASIIDLHITGNSTFDDQTTKSQYYGLQSFGPGTCRDFTVVDNDFANNKAGGILWGNGTPANSTIGPNKTSE